MCPCNPGCGRSRCQSPHPLVRELEPTVPASPPLKVEWYRFKDSLSADMAGCDLLISHAGAGSVTEGLRLRKLLVVVVNDQLMHNHQQELAQELHSRAHLLATTPSGLAETLRGLSTAPPALTPLPPADPMAFGRYLGTALGLQ